MGLTWHDVYLASPELAMASLALLVVLSGLVLRRPGVTVAIALAGLTAPMLLGLALWDDVHGMAAGGEVGFNGSLVVDKFALFFKFLIVGALALLLLASKDALAKFRYPAEFVGLVLLSATGLMLLAAAADLITMFVALELASLPVVALAAFTRGQARSAEAGIKYLLLSAISSAVPRAE